MTIILNNERRGNLQMHHKNKSSIYYVFKTSIKK